MLAAQELRVGLRELALLGKPLVRAAFQGLEPVSLTDLALGAKLELLPQLGKQRRQELTRRVWPLGWEVCYWQKVRPAPPLQKVLTG
jgi:hypothetical protein